MADPTDPEAILARYIQCQEIMARAARNSGFNGPEVAAASLFYYVASIIFAGSSVEDAYLAVLTTYQFIRQNPRLRVIDISSIPLN